MDHRRRLAMLLMSGLALAACGPSAKEKASGTTSDPVDVCEETSQVCRFQGAKLGVCTREPDGKLSCTSQH